MEKLDCKMSDAKITKGEVSDAEKPVNEIYHIAIDGPPAGGKSTVAGVLSKKLGIPHLDTGAIYRGVAVFAKDNLMNEKTLDLEKIKMEVTIDRGLTKIKIDFWDATNLLRDNDISILSAKLATLPAVRKYCIAKIQELAAQSSLILDGRDISHAVLPNAKYKFFLTANPKVRTARRLSELKKSGNLGITFKVLYKQIKQRDKMEKPKHGGGLVRVQDAVYIDSSKLSVNEVAEQMLNYIK